MLQTNLDRLYLLSFLAIHFFFAMALFSPLQPLESILRFLQPSLLLISMTAYLSSILPLIMLHQARTSALGQKIKPRRAASQEYKIAGVTLQPGSPALHYYLTFTQISTGMSISLHAISGLFLAAFQASALILYSSSSEDWLPYQTITFRNAQGLRISSLRPNERFFFLLGCNFVVGALFALYRIAAISTYSSSAGSSSDVNFEAQATLQSPAVRISKKVRRRLPTSMAIGLALPVSFLLLYVATRRPLFRLILSIIGHDSALRPILIPSFRKTFFSIKFVLRLSALGAFSAATWETIAILWEVFSTQPFNDLHGGLSQYSREPSRCLIEGMQSRTVVVAKEGISDPSEAQYYAQFAFAEMAVVTATGYERRRAIFREVGAGSSNGTTAVGNKSAWVLIAEQCVKVIQEERIAVMDRGRSNAVSRNAAPVQGTTSRLKADDANHKVPVEDGSSIMKRSSISIWDKLASTGGAAPPATSAPASASSTSTAQTVPQEEGLGSILRKLVPPPPTAAAGGTNRATPASSSALTTGKSPTQRPPTAVSVVSSILLTSTSSVAFFTYSLLPEDLRHVLSRLPVVRSAMPFRDWLTTPTSATLLYTGELPRQAALTTWSIQILGALLSASVEQDEYGTVALSAQQKLGVDDILEQMATLLSALSQWGLDIAKEMEGQNVVTKRDMTASWDARVAPMVVAARSAINLVMGVFEPTGYQVRSSTREMINRALKVE